MSPAPGGGVQSKGRARALAQGFQGFQGFQGAKIAGVRVSECSVFGSGRGSAPAGWAAAPGRSLTPRGGAHSRRQRKAPTLGFFRVSRM